jgi:hypothetical protein
VSVARTNAARVRGVVGASSSPLDITRRLRHPRATVVHRRLTAAPLAAFPVVDVTMGRIKAYRAR